MEHKSLIIKFEEGEVTDVLLRADLNQTYRALFMNACHAAKHSQNNVAHGVKIVIFGAFLIEAQANE
ncbi:MAG: hypothetical protein NTU90_01425, partial [Proteobacteria bacterium]|nr:hypothetical protein [Pseudomonadota bacterium]